MPTPTFPSPPPARAPRPSRRSSAAAIGLALALAALSATHAARAAPTVEADTKAVLGVLQTVFDGLAQRDHDMVRGQLLPGGMATLVRDGKPVQLDWNAFVERLPATGTTRLAEIMHHPEVRIDDDIAVIWAPYSFTIDDKPHHCGTDIVNLYRRDGTWLISSLADNSRTQCAAFEPPKR